MVEAIILSLVALRQKNDGRCKKRDISTTVS
jgi:hypothetical protein